MEDLYQFRQDPTKIRARALFPPKLVDTIVPSEHTILNHESVVRRTEMDARTTQQLLVVVSSSGM
jgi:hypothetical protein